MEGGVKGLPSRQHLALYFGTRFKMILISLQMNTTYTMYADDHQLYSAGQTVKEVQDILNKEGEIISKWYESNLLKSNYEKYEIMSMRPKDKTKDLEMNNVKFKNKVWF